MGISGNTGIPEPVKSPGFHSPWLIHGGLPGLSGHQSGKILRWNGMTGTCISYHMNDGLQSFCAAGPHGSGGTANYV